VHFVAAFEPADALVAVDLGRAHASWHHRAACVGKTSLFVPERASGNHYRATAELYGAAPVRAECDAEGDELPPLLRQFGYRAGRPARARARRRPRLCATSASAAAR
jgi:hypothetical protein